MTDAEERQARLRAEVVDQLGYAPWEDRRSRADPDSGRQKKQRCPTCDRLVLKIIQVGEAKPMCKGCLPKKKRGRPRKPKILKLRTAAIPTAAPAAPVCGCSAPSVYASGLCEACKELQLARLAGNPLPKVALSLVVGQ